MRFLFIEPTEPVVNVIGRDVKSSPLPLSRHSR